MMMILVHQFLLISVILSQSIWESNRIVQDLELSAFSWSDVRSITSRCSHPEPSDEVGYAWCAGNSNGESWLQVDLGKPYLIQYVVTWGRNSPNNEQWVTSYNLSYSLDGITFINDDISNPLNGNENDYDESVNLLDPMIIAQYLRFTPITWNEHPSMKIEASGIS